MDRLDLVRVLSDTRAGFLHSAESTNGEKFLVKLVRDGDQESGVRLRYETRIFAEHYSNRIAAPAPNFATQAPGNGSVLRYFDGISLSQYLQSEKPGLVQALKIALSICKGLADLHSNGICHNDVHPRNMLVNPDSASVLFVDCSACYSQGQVSEALAPPLDISSLPYLAPECFQGTLSARDEHADLYALGVILYRLITGRFPLMGTDLIEWRHAHLARTPPDASLIDPAVPSGVSDMIMSLLKKLPEERYQSAAGLCEDLQLVIPLLEQGKPISNPMLHRMTAFHKFRIPDTLYGREPCERDLDAALNRVIATRTQTMVLVIGEPGSGKTALITQFCKRRENDANFASGKFDQYSRHGPYRVLVSALSSLIDKVLRKGEREILSMRERLLAAVGQNGQLITSLVPGLELLIGSQPDVPDMPPSQAANRFRIVGRNFLRALAGGPFPLVLILDDIQWADKASLDALNDLVQDKEPAAILIAVSFRKDDDLREPALKEFLHGQERKGQALQRIETPCLEYESVYKLVRDVVRRDEEQTAEFARRLLQSTSGNPLSIRVVLSTLHDKGNLWFDRSEMRWVWNEASVNSLPLSANFVEEVLSKLRALDADTVYVISRAAFMGEEGSIEFLSRVCAQSEGSTISALTEAERIGFLKLSKDRYRFLHDRFREAAFLQVPQSEHTNLHLCIARFFMEDQSGSHPENIFEPLYHFNMAFESIVDPAEKEMVGRLNLAAGQRARKANAYHEASLYYRNAVSLIDEEKWGKQYQYALATSLEFAECEYFAGRPESATATLDHIENKVINDADRARVYQLRIWLHEVAGRYDLALLAALKSLRDVGVDFPTSKTKIYEEIAAEHATLMARLEELDFNSIENDRGSGSSRAGMAVSLMSEALLPAYFENLPLSVLITLRGTSLLLGSPLYPGASALFIQFGYYLAKVAGKARLAGQFSDLAVRLSRKDSDLRWRGTTSILHADHVNPRLRHISTDFPYLEEGIQWCLRTGDLVWAGIGSFIYPWQAFEKGEELEEVLKLVERFSTHAQNIANKPVLQTIQLEGQFVKCLLGRTHSPTSFSDDAFSERTSIRAVKQPFFSPAFVHYHVMKQIVFFFDGDMRGALRSSVRAHALLPQMHGFPIEVTHTLFYALTLIALLRSGESGPQLEQAEDKLGELVKRATVWAEDCPVNWRHIEKLLLAEIAQNGSDDFNAQRLYEEAVSNARKGGFIQHEALANELAACFFIRRGLRKFASIYANDAVSCYERWGARSKVDRLRMAWSELLTASPMLHPVEFDSLAITRAIQAISSEIALDRLLDAVMRVVLQTAGAQAARLVVQEEGAYTVLAKAVVEREAVSVSISPALLDLDKHLMPEVLDYVGRTGKHLVLREVRGHSAGQKLGSVLCFPLCRKSSIVGFVYLEHFDLPDVFDENVLAVMEVICSQIAVSLENARLHAKLANEVSLKRTAEQKFEYASSHDELTGLPNRKMLIDHLSHFIQHARQDVDSCAVLVVDLDRFKDINDSFGHSVGDRLLVLVCERLQHCCKDEGVLSRLGSDEFAAMIPFTRSEVEPANLAQRFLDVLALPFLVETHQLHLEACVGISLFPADGLEAEILLRSAETALYFAKQKGRGTYRFFEAALNDAVQKRLSLEHRLRNAFEQNELRLYYQPQIHLASSRIYSAEALLRFEFPGQPAVSCGALLQAAEESSLILTIGEWTIRQACGDLKRWHALGFSRMRVAVNLTPRQFFRSNFREWLEKLLQQQAIDPATLVFEITEGMLMEPSAENYEVLESITRMGIQLSIDDFGTGYSSLSYLQRFPVHELKIDQAFVRGIQQNAGDRALVSAIVAMGRSLQLEVLAEGVETSVQEDFLRSAGCASAQGYLYGKAMPSNRFAELLMSRY
jgi:diguanylate cyclase (GGDEF)-like protein